MTKSAQENKSKSRGLFESVTNCCAVFTGYHLHYASEPETKNGKNPIKIHVLLKKRRLIFIFETDSEWRRIGQVKERAIHLDDETRYWRPRLMNVRKFPEFLV